MHNDQRLEPSHTHVKLSTNICLIIILILAFFYRCGDCHLFFNIRFDLYCRAHLRAKYFCTTANHIWKVSCESRAIVLAMQSQLKESMVAKQSWLLRGASWWWLPQVILSQAWASVRLGPWQVTAWGPGWLLPLSLGLSHGWEGTLLISNVPQCLSW